MVSTHAPCVRARRGIVEELAHAEIVSTHAPCVRARRAEIEIEEECAHKGCIALPLRRFWIREKSRWLTGLPETETL